MPIQHAVLSPPSAAARHVEADLAFLDDVEQILVADGPTVCSPGNDRAASPDVAVGVQRSRIHYREGTRAAGLRGEASRRAGVSK
ncbi:MAG: hypothetical protein HKP61_00555 [Dactylosporangium sp.]|nr:hypothetical protein [Dactylosporangium sp.]NNJ59462.1 hypothetical protein [Dactylosporangium sp.]